jgi:S1-C subfamily serine protease
MKDPKTRTGSGFYIGNKRILTNSHVVHNATSIRLERHGKPGNFAGRVLCETPVCDLALLTVDDEDFWRGLPEITFQSSVPELDDTVLAVGYPLGSTTVTVTRGVVSAVKMKDLSLTNAAPAQLTVQIDAAINPGNSGGPVFNQDTKEVVGVAFAGASHADGTGFIIPIPVVKNFITTYNETGAFGLLPSLGVQVQTLLTTWFVLEYPYRLHTL